VYRTVDQQSLLFEVFRAQDANFLDLSKELVAAERSRQVIQREGLRCWYVNGQGQTMVVIPGQVEFEMGSPATEAGRYAHEPQHKKRIGRTFAIAAKAVTMEQFMRLDREYTIDVRYRDRPNLPAVGLSWYEAARYCNRLSKEEGIAEDQWCYEQDGAKGVTCGIVKLKANYLSLVGYRLPTEAEMEYATRAGAVTSRYFGETVELLPNYAWHSKNSMEKTWPVGSLKPNDLGLFDVQGNSRNWCQESYLEYPAWRGLVDDTERDLIISATDDCLMRGGSFNSPSSSVRSAYRGNNQRANRSLNLGFRSARTLPPGSLTAPTP
jgi:eukaryotic-like serine/threonine-protein kinase